MEEDILDYSPTAMFRETPCTTLQIDGHLKLHRPFNG